MEQPHNIITHHHLNSAAGTQGDKFNYLSLHFDI